MIPTAIAYVIIIVGEWRYMKKRKRKGRSKFIVLGLSVFMLVILEILIGIKEFWRFVDPIIYLFGPVQKWLLLKS